MRAFVITMAVIHTLAVGMRLAKSNADMWELIVQAVIGAWAWWLVLT